MFVCKTWFCLPLPALHNDTIQFLVGFNMRICLVLGFPAGRAQVGS